MINKIDSARVEREKIAHDDDDVLAKSYNIKNLFCHIFTYPSRKRATNYFDEIINEVKGKRVLDYGCGLGENSLKYLKAGAHVTGIDIADSYIAIAKENARNNGHSKEQYDFIVMDAHKLDFPDESFNFIVGMGILHHLQDEIALKELHRVLKKNGRLSLMEPLADNPLLRLFRKLTPSARTNDERPFNRADIQRFDTVCDWQILHRYCGILEAPIAILTSILFRPWPNNILLRVADIAEKWLHKRGVLLSWNQYIILIFKKKGIEDLP